MNQDRFQPSHVIKRQIITEEAEKATKLLGQKRTAQLQEQILIGQELAALTEMPGWTRVEKILTSKMMKSVELGHAEVTQAFTSVLRLVYLPIQLAEKAQKKLAEDAEKERENERRKSERGTGKQRSIFSRRAGRAG